MYPNAVTSLTLGLSLISRNVADPRGEIQISKISHSRKTASSGLGCDAKGLYCLATGKVDFAVTLLFSIMAHWEKLGMVIAASPPPPLFF